ncbi:MAG TPA: hypothetical protein VFM86_11460 [Pedococcus sp.]|nr:hypothetical protein [Pedococcus sp.]
MSIETQLREALAARADDVAPTVEDPWSRVDGAIRTSARRRRAAYAGVTAAVVALAVLVPGLVGGSHRATTPATRTGTVQLPAPGDPRWQRIATWPVRGSLAQDAAFLSAATRRFDGTSARILFAGDVEDSRLVLAFTRTEVPPDTATGEVGTTEHVRVLVGPRGSALDKLQPGPDQQPGDVDALVVRPDLRADGWLMVLAQPGVRTAELSTSVSISPSGSVGRTWAPLALTDGVGVTRVHDAPLGVTRVRAGGYDGNAVVVASNQDDSDGTAGAAFCGGCGEAFYATGVEAAREGIARTLGLQPAQVEVSAHVQGRIDRTLQVKDGMYGTPGSVARVLVVHARVPGGGVVRSVAVSVTERDGTGSLLQPEDIVPIDAATATGRPWVAWAPDTKGSGLTLQVFAPGAAGIAITSDAPTIFPGSPREPVRNGSALVHLDSDESLLQHYVVVGYDAAGHETGRWPLRPTNLADPLDLGPGH